MTRTLLNRSDSMKGSCLKENILKKTPMFVSEAGNVLIVTLILLVLLTLLGLSASRISSVDIQVAGNNKIYKQNFYTAEAAAMEAIQIMNDTDLSESVAPSWLAKTTSDGSVSLSENDIRDKDKWASGFTGVATAKASSITPGSAKFLAVARGVVKGGESLEIAKTKIYEYEAYGYCNRNNGTSIIELGYRKAF